jgi:hypothetical protein
MIQSVFAKYCCNWKPWTLENGRLWGPFLALKRSIAVDTKSGNLPDLICCFLLLKG